jgi:hypothetical protein
MSKDGTMQYIRRKFKAIRNRIGMIGKRPAYTAAGLRNPLFWIARWLRPRERYVNVTVNLSTGNVAKITRVRWSRENPNYVYVDYQPELTTVDRGGGSYYRHEDVVNLKRAALWTAQRAVYWPISIQRAIVALIVFPLAAFYSYRYVGSWALLWSIPLIRELLSYRSIAINPEAGRSVTDIASAARLVTAGSIIRKFSDPGVWLSHTTITLIHPPYRKHGRKRPRARIR